MMISPTRLADHHLSLSLQAGSWSSTASAAWTASEPLVRTASDPDSGLG